MLELTVLGNYQEEENNGNRAAEDEDFANLSYCCVITSYTDYHGLHSLGKRHNISAVFQGPCTSSCHRILQGQLRLAQLSEQTKMSLGSSQGWQTESLSWRGHVESQKIAHSELVWK